MNIVVDAGNTTIKLGVFTGSDLSEKHSFRKAEELKKFLSETACTNILISSVTEEFDVILTNLQVTGKKLFLTPELFLPLINRYATPATLGVDRLAGACGAWHLFPNQSSLVIDMGTCINYEFVTRDGEYLGGAISPGMRMRFEAMHHFTAKLPIAEPVEHAKLTGDSTLSCLQSGVMTGITEEINGVIKRYKNEHPGLKVILCGGDAHFFEKHVNTSIFVAPELVLLGLNSILLNNVKS